MTDISGVQMALLKHFNNAVGEIGKTENTLNTWTFPNKITKNLADLNL
jgi:hypothetical protein